MKIGKVPESVLKRSILRQIRNRRQEVLCSAGVGVDCAVLLLSGEERLVTCVQEGTGDLRPGKYNPAGNTSWLRYLIIKCMNNLAAAGGEPVAVSIALMLPEWTEEACLKALIKEAEDTCAGLGVAIAGGQTTVTGALMVPAATVTGYGKTAEEADHSVRAARPGQDIVVSKWIGLEGTALLAERYRERLLKRYPSRLVEAAAGFDRYLSVFPEAAAAVKAEVRAMHDASQGGIFGALWELAEGAGMGLTVELRKLPLRQETVEVCELCGVNPYELLSGGCLLMTADDGERLARTLAAEKIPAAVVGKVTDSNDRILINGDEIRYLDKPKQDEIWRLGTGGEEFT